MGVKRQDLDGGALCSLDTRNAWDAESKGREGEGAKVNTSQILQTRQKGRSGMDMSAFDLFPADSVQVRR